MHCTQFYFQAIENGVKLKSLYTTLEEAINNIKDHQRWEEWKIEINRVSGAPDKGRYYLISTILYFWGNK